MPPFNRKCNLGLSNFETAKTLQTSLYQAILQCDKCRRGKANHKKTFYYRVLGSIRNKIIRKIEMSKASYNYSCNMILIVIIVVA